MVTKSTNTAKILLFADVLKLKQAERIAQFASRDQTMRRVFSELGKLYFAIEAELKAGQTITGVLKKADVRPGTISNAAYAAKVFKLVRTQHITEAQYDSLTFRDCYTIETIIRPQGMETIKAVFGSKSYLEELDSYAEHGLSRAEVKEKATEAKRTAASKSAATTVSAKSGTKTSSAAATTSVSTDAKSSPRGTDEESPGKVVPMSAQENNTEPSQDELKTYALELVDELASTLEKLEDPAPVIAAIRKMLGDNVGKKKAA